MACSSIVMGSLALLAIMMSAQLVGCENRRSRRMLPSIRPIQTVGVEGQLMCGSKPLAGAKITLWDKDTFTPDDKMGSATTDSQGKFHFQGSEHQFTTLTPKLEIVHDCKKGWNPCWRKVSMDVPKKYVASGDHVKEWYNLGALNMEAKMKGESRKCFG